MSESTQSNSVGVQPSTTSTGQSGSAKRSESSSRSEGSKRGKKVYDNVSGESKSPNSSADARGPVTKIKRGHGDKEEVPVYPGMTVGYSQGPGRENYDEGQYSSDSVNAWYEARQRDGLDLPG